MDDYEEEKQINQISILAGYFHGESSYKNPDFVIQPNPAKKHRSAFFAGLLIKRLHINKCTLMGYINCTLYTKY